MIAERKTLDIDSVEQLTMYSLDRSDDGLSMLVDDVRSCGDMLGSDRDEGLARLFPLVERLHDFGVFEHSVCSLFGVDRTKCRDEKGNLRANVDAYRLILEKILAELENGDIAALSLLLRSDLSDQLSRFKELMPVLRGHIDQDFNPMHDEREEIQK